ncbi:MAG: hypothetical protein PHX74_01790 [Candidatus Sumerlaeales bacterium]|nr:hypothetical protein [Candidatus Sumerlaeales bacterium]
MKIVGVFSLIAVALTMGVDANADTLVLKSGKSMSGAVISKTRTEIQIQTDLGRLSFPLDEVASLEYSGLLPYEVTADTAMKNNRLKQALGLLTKAKGQVPADSEAGVRIQKKIDAIEIRIPEQMNAQAKVLFDKAQKAYNDGKYDEAFAIVESAGNDLRLNSSYAADTQKLLAKIYIGRGKDAANRQNWTGSMEQFASATEEDPELVEAWMLYGMALLNDSTKEAKGVEILKKWLSKGKADLTPADQYRYNLLLGQKLRDNRQYVEAIFYFGECLKLIDAVSSNGAEAYDALSDCLMSLEKTQWVKIDTGYYAELLDQIRGGSGDSFYLLRSILMGHNGDYAAAWNNMDKHLSQSSRSERRSLLTEAWLRGNIGESEEAMKDCMDFNIGGDKREWESQAMLSWLSMLNGDYDGATTIAEIAINAATSKWAPVYALAEATYAHGLEHQDCKLNDSFFRDQTPLEVARKALREARRLSPGNPMNYILTARVMTAQKEFEPAKKYLKETEDYLSGITETNFEVKSQKQKLLLAKADLEYAQGNKEEAAKLLTEAQDILPNEMSPKAQELLSVKWPEIKEAYKSNLETSGSLIAEGIEIGNAYLANPGCQTVAVKKVLAYLTELQEAKTEEAMSENLKTALGITSYDYIATTPTAADAATSATDATTSAPVAGAADPNAPQQGAPGVPQPANAMNAAAPGQLAAPQMTAPVAMPGQPVMPGMPAAAPGQLAAPGMQQAPAPGAPGGQQVPF